MNTTQATDALTSATERLVVVHPDADTLVQATAARLLTRILDVQSVRRPVHVVVTGGTVGIKTLAAIATHPVRDAVDWTGVHIWWGDERFVPDGDADRNEQQARDALIDQLAQLPAENVHVMLPPGAPGIETPEQSAEAYVQTLREHAEDGAASPAFDVLLLGMGPDGHIASLFPGHPGLDITGVSAAGVHNSPKPPPERVTLTFETIHAAREVWVVAAGAEKADAVASALGGADVHTTPAAGALGTERTLWLVDTSSAGSLA